MVIASQLVPNPINPLTESSLRSPSSGTASPNSTTDRPSKSHAKLTANTAASSHGITRK